MSYPKRSLDSKRCPEWSDLPIELVAVIANHVKSIHDYLSFRGVCNLWRSAATFDNFDSAFPRVPWLMYFTTKKEEKGYFGPYVSRIANFFDMSTNKTYKIYNFPSTSWTKYVSSIGWILSISGYDVYLTHPVWRIRMELPGLNTFLNKHRNHPLTAVISKMVLSGSPTLEADLVIMVIWGRNHQLAFCRPGDSSWTILASWKGSFRDIIYHNHRLYGLDNSRRIVECDIYGPNPTQIRQVFSLPSPQPSLNVALHSTENLYMLETSGKFLIISQLVNNIFTTLSFRVFEVDLIDGSYKEVHDLEKKALFLGFNSSVCLDLTNQNEVKANCIYFTSHLGLPKDKDVNVYCLSNTSFHTSKHGLPHPMCAPATWVLPSL